MWEELEICSSLAIFRYNQNKIIMEKVTVYSNNILGSYSPEGGNLAEGFIADCELIGTLKGIEGGSDTLVFEGEYYVCLLTVDSGYGRPSIAIHDKAVLKEIKNRLQ